MILMLLDLYNIPGLAGFFTGMGTTIDAVLTTLISGQATILQATGNGSLLAYSLARAGCLMNLRCGPPSPRPRGCGWWPPIPACC
jgi:hypothetical protein